MGEGEDTEIGEPIDPVPLPPELTNDNSGNLPAEYGARYGAYYVHRISAVSYLPGKQYKTTEYDLVRLLDTSGVSEFSTVQIPFDPLSEQVFINEVRVVDGSGKTVSTGSTANYYVLDDGAATTASQKRVVNIPIPGLHAGCQVSVIYTKLELGRMDDFPFCAYCFSKPFPIWKSVFFLAGDGAGLKHRPSFAIAPQRLTTGLCWQMSDPMVARWEPLQPSGADFLPMLWISDQSNQWNSLGKDYLASIEDRLETDAEVQKAARQLVSGVNDPDSMISALSSYVETNLTYKAIEFGRRARIPNRPADVLRNKYGDCKDHAVLLQQMLTSVGIDARLALVGHDGPVQKDLPSLDQFDHMIVYVPEGQNGRFLDCTSKGADVAHVIPNGLAQSDAFVLDKTNPHFVAIPAYPTNASTLSVERRIRLSESNDLAVDETLTLTGVHASYMRNYLLRIPESSRLSQLQAQMGMTEANVTETKVDSLNDLTKPLRLHFLYSIRRKFHKSGGEWRGALNAGFAGTYLEAAPSENRATPFEITIPFSVYSRTLLEAPTGFHAEVSKTAMLNIDPQFAQVEESAQTGLKHLELDVNFRQMTGKFKASEYAAYRETMAQTLALLQREVVFRTDAH